MTGWPSGTLVTSSSSPFSMWGGTRSTSKQGPQQLASAREPPGFGAEERSALALQLPPCPVLTHACRADVGNAPRSPAAEGQPLLTYNLHVEVLPGLSSRTAGQAGVVAPILGSYLVESQHPAPWQHEAERSQGPGPRSSRAGAPPCLNPSALGQNLSPKLPPLPASTSQP